MQTVEKVVGPTQADTNDKCCFCLFQFSVKYGNFGNLARPSEDFQFRGVPDSRKGFARLVEEISEELTT